MNKPISSVFSVIRRCARVVLPAILLGSMSVTALAAFPDKPIRMIVPFSPGGGTDLVARAIADGMSKELGQPIIVENKPGAGTIIGDSAVAKSAPDGYTLVMATFAHAVNPAIRQSMPFDTDKDFAPVILVGRSPNVLLVRNDAPYKTVKDLIAAAKAAPGKITFGSQGNGTSAHLAGELFKSLAGVNLTHVPYRGAGPALTDLIGGQIDMMFATSAAAKSFVQTGKLRALAVTTDERSPAWPGVPTMAEAGVPGFAAESWYGLFAPAGTPPDVIARLNAAAQHAAHTESFKKRSESEGLSVVAGTPEEFGKYFEEQEARWRKVIKDAHLPLQ